MGLDQQETFNWLREQAYDEQGHFWKDRAIRAEEALRKIAYDDDTVYLACSDIPLCQGIGPYGHAEDCAVGIARAALNTTDKRGEEKDG